MSILYAVLAAVLLLGPLIAIHEFGHFWVARRFGVKVLVYSIGFGRPLLKWQGKDGTQYQIAAIPLGGYVRMLGETDGEDDPIAPEDLPRALNRQSPWVRMAIVAAGPVINLIFAVFLYWLLFLPASEQLNTRIGSVYSGSVAAQVGLDSGDRIVKIDGQDTPTWEAINYALVDRMGESGSVRVTVQKDPTAPSSTAQNSAALTEYRLPINNFLRSSQDPLSQLGFYPWQPKIPAVIAEMTPNSAAARQGLKVGDRLLKINNQAIDHWLEVTRIVQANPEKLLKITVQRGQQQLTINVMPQGKRDAMGATVGHLGVAVAPAPSQLQAPADYRQLLQYNPWTALLKAVEKTWDLSLMTVSAFAKMLTGLIGLDNLSGPITIAKVAGHSADLGWQAFIAFMAMMSVSLGVLNLLPIPVLDGGHLVYYFIEAVRGKPMSAQVQAFGFRIGMALLGTLMFLALFNDFSRLG